MPRSASSSFPLALALRIAAHPVLAVVVVAGVAGAAWYNAWEFLIPPIAWTLIGFVGARLRPPALPGRPVRPAEEPELAELVQDVAERLGFRAPLSVRVAPVVDAGLMRTTFRSGHAFGLLLGWPLLRGCSVAELRGIVAHELAHEQHTADAAARVLNAREDLVDSLERVVHLPRRAATWLLRRTQPLSFQVELAADQDAARIVGAAAFSSALNRTEVLSAAYEVLADQWLAAVEDREERPEDLFEEMDRALADPQVLARLEQLVAYADVEQPDAADSHPSTRVRAAAVGAAAERLPGEPLRLRAQAEIDAWCLEALGFGDPFKSVRLAELDLHTLRAEQDDAERDLTAATGTDSAASALAAAVNSVSDGSWRSIAERLEPSVRDAPQEIGDFARRSVFGGVVSRALALSLWRAGWESANRWMVTMLSAPDGDSVFVRELVEDATKTGDAGRLRELLLAVEEGARR
jgi:Zn-dependent protease with chaperone function